MLPDPPVSEPTHEITIDRKVAVPMRDGTILYADVYRPVTPGRYPVIVERVGYELDYRVGPYAAFFATRGYVFVGQNTRGKFWSEGEHDFGNDGWGERQDGYDTIEWAGTRAWSSGRVGTMDGSYSGYTQYALAPTRPPHLISMFVRSGPSNLHRDFAPGGAQRDLRAGIARHLLFELKHESAAPGSGSVIARIEEALADPELISGQLPLRENLALAGVDSPDNDPLMEIFDHPDYGPYWEPANALSKLHEADVPIFHLSGWFDFLMPATIAAYETVSRDGHSEFARDNQRLMVGPWQHGEFAPDEQSLGELEFGSDASIGLNEFRLCWFDRWLKNVQNDSVEWPRVRLFVMGDNQWEDHDEWPPVDVVYTQMYFHEGSGRTEESLNGGVLSFDVPDDSEQSDSYDYDPMDPVRGAPPASDMTSIEGRILTYTSSVLDRDLKVVGPVRVILHASSSALDTDWIVRLCDVWPDGRSIGLQVGAMRARYRDSFEKPELMTPGEVYTFEVDLSATANVFKAGHRIRLHVTSSDFPGLGRNFNTGGINAAETVGIVAHNTIFHDASRPSHVLLPVIPRGR